VKTQLQSTNEHDFGRTPRESVANRSTRQSDSCDNNPPFQRVHEEHFVDAEAASAFLSITRRQLLAMARNGAVPAYPSSLGSRRKQWRFRLSELATAITEGLKEPLRESANRMDNGSRQSRSSRKGRS
jgi:hypothetical protein